MEFSIIIIYNTIGFEDSETSQKFNEFGDNTDLKKWIYETSIDGIDIV